VLFGRRSVRQYDMSSEASDTQRPSVRDLIGRLASPFSPASISFAILAHEFPFRQYQVIYEAVQGCESMQEDSVEGG
jgi:hypothetical protein